MCPRVKTGRVVVPKLNFTKFSMFLVLDWATPFFVVFFFQNNAAQNLRLCAVVGPGFFRVMSSFGYPCPPTDYNQL